MRNGTKIALKSGKEGFSMLRQEDYFKMGRKGFLFEEKQKLEPSEL